jgi:hypothetical protein
LTDLRAEKLKSDGELAAVLASKLELQSELEREKSGRTEAQERARAALVAAEEARKKMQAAVAEAVSMYVSNIREQTLLLLAKLLVSVTHFLVTTSRLERILGNNVPYAMHVICIGAAGCL